MRGRKPTPTALKEIKGNPGHRPLNKSEPELPVASVSAEPPGTMNAAARAVWHEHIAKLTVARVLTDGDLPVFVAFCNYYAEYLKYEERVELDGPFMIVPKRDKDGKPIPGAFYTEWHPARIMRDSAYSKYRELASDLGLTPSSRSRVQKDNSPAGSERTADEIRARLRA